MKLDILVFSAHPDDAELACSGTILKEVAAGKKVGIVDLTRGELGTRGTADERDVEAANSAKILGLSARENLRMRDGFFSNDEAHQLQVIKAIRKYQPDIVLCNALEDRHPDHARASELAITSCFLSGLIKIQTELDGVEQTAWRPRLVLQYIQDNYIQPDVLVDVTEFWDGKMASIYAFKSQFHNPEYDQAEQTYISSPEFLKVVEARSREFGKAIGGTFAEGFTSKKLLGVNSLSDLL